MRTYIHENRTPNGNPFKVECRLGTNDQDVAHSVSKLDEYGLRGREFEGWALDIGASIGAVAIPLAIDHPGLKVVAVEPVPENAAALYRNIDMNDVADRVFVVQLAAAADEEPTIIRYGGTGVHRFVANAHEVGPDGEEFRMESISLEGLMDELDGVALLKIDCEGCEWSVLEEYEAVKRCALIVGEFHDETQQQGADRIHDLLDWTHLVTVERWAFTAERR